MKKMILIMAVFPVWAIAQMNFPSMPEGMSQQNMGNMQAMMEQMQKMQECMSKVDQTQLDSLERQSDQLAKDIQNLCRKGKKDKAQTKAVNFVNSLKTNKALIQMKSCFSSTMPNRIETPFEQMAKDIEQPNNHVCRQFK